MASFRKYGGVSYSHKHNFVGAQRIYAKSESMSLSNITQLHVYSTATIEGIIYTNGGLVTNTINVPFTDSSKWYIESTGNITGTQFSMTSDYRIKQNITNLTPCTSSPFNKIRPVQYTNTLTNTEDYGVIAHELQEIYPELVTGTKDMPNKHQTVNYIGLIALLIHEVQELKKGANIIN
jgi:hypothetical protein